MTPNLRKFALALHMTVSVGWVGAAAIYLLLAAAAISSAEPPTWRMGWTALELVGWYALVPMAVMSLLTGLVMSLGTSWGLVRHYWVLVSFLLTTVATAILVRHMIDVSAFARVVSATRTDMPELRTAFRGELIHAGLGLALLVGIELLNVYKPRGLTPFGRIGDASEAVAVAPRSPRPEDDLGRQPLWLRVVVGHVIALVLLAGIIHVAGRIQH